MASKAEAKGIIDKLAEKYGALDGDMMNEIGTWKPEYRLKIDRAWLTLETAAAHSIKTLATNIYDSGARFVFELLQNADDNIFKTAIDNSDLPFVTFKVYPRRIIIECNEDGFTEKNLEALCAVGQSTKTEAGSGYIGNKGIGFKSVFIAASKVYIQSRHFSFQFEHKKADPGLGMVRPIWKETSETLPWPLTRMTLTLHDDGDAAQVERDALLLEEQMKNLQATCLLFLQKLQQITVEFYNEDDKLQKSSQFTKRKVNDYRVALETTTTTGEDKPAVKSQLYHITKNTAVGIEPRKNQTKATSEGDKAVAQSAEIVLVFPLSDDGEPLVEERQSLFAFLPLRESKYSFIIQSDFDTNVQREDINTTSTRNLHLRDWIAKTFVQAVLEFCTDDKLCYSWPAFLPSLDANYSKSDFWFGLNKSIEALLKETAILKSRSRPDLRRIGDILILPDNVMLENGTPVLDTDADLFLSPRYSNEARRILSYYGLQPISLDKFVSLVQADLLRGDSKMKNDATNDEWHTIVAKFLTHALNNTACSRRIRDLRLIPLRGGEWVSINSGDVYFPTTKAVPIPDEVDLKILAQCVAQNPSRKALYTKLGVAEASAQLVVHKIISNMEAMKPRLVLNWVAQLKYIYMMQTGDSPLHDGVKTLSVPIASNDNKPFRPFLTDIYLPDQGRPFSPDVLLAANETAPELTVLFAHRSYVQEQPEQPPGNPLPWLTWLYRSVGVREHLRLFNKDATQLSETSLYVLKHQPSKFLGLVKHLWPHEAGSAKNNSPLRQVLNDLPAQDLCGVGFAVPMNRTYLPLSGLRARIETFMDDPAQFPFLQLPPASNSTENATDDELKVQWAFLNAHFGVGKEDDVSFLLHILHHIQRSSPKELSSISQVQKVYDLYEAIEAALSVTSGKEKEAATKHVQRFLADGGVLVAEDPVIWTKAGRCVWNAPLNMATKFSLRALYARTLGEDQLERIERLFSKVANIPNAAKQDILDELILLRGIDVELSETHELYEYLWNLNCDAWELRQAFKAAPLILASVQGQAGWYNVDDCIWSSTTIIRGKATLDTDYEDLKEFFVGVLNVKLISLELLYDELKSTRADEDIEHVKANVMAFAGMLERPQQITLDCNPLRKAAIFPVSYSGSPAVLRAVDNTEFAIGDRDYLTSKFVDKIALLDLELQDVRRLGPFFEWLGITDRYLSNSVEEYTSVSDESGRPIESGPRDLSRNAHCILRIAASFNSVRYQRNREGLYEQLRSMKVIQVRDIRNCLKLRQNGRTATSEEAAGAEHISDTDGLVIYVPRGKAAQNLCFSSELPQKFARWLLEDRDAGIASYRTNNEAVSVLTSVFANLPSVARDILHRRGIQQISIEDLDAPDDSFSDSDDDDSLYERPSPGAAESELTPLSADDIGSGTLSVEATRTENITDSVTVVEVHHATAHSRAEANTYERPFEVPHFSPHAAVTARELIQNSQARSQSRIYIQHPFTTQDPVTERSQYISILSRVIAAAQSAAFPSYGAFNLSGLADALPNDYDPDDVQSFDGLDVYPPFRSTSKFERDKKIGAAGELYVFELLKSLNLPGWGVDNWQSRIRMYVRAHEDYASLESWDSRETSDLIYDDVDGEFTRLLMDCGYLAQEKWQDARPKYFIEVKSTTGPCDLPFYVSANQYQLMEEKYQSFEDNSAIYMVVRVFWLNSDRIGIRVYVNPWQMMEDGRLIFTVPSWLVIPGQSDA